MNNWIDPIQLEEGFWAECFVAIKTDGQTFVEINDVKRTSDNVYWYCNNFKEWVEFRADVPVKLAPLEYPTISEEDW